MVELAFGGIPDGTFADDAAHITQKLHITPDFLPDG
jgi:hypothetical protein